MDSVAVVGGGYRLGSGTPLNGYDSYDPATDTWDTVSSFIDDQRSLSGSFSLGNRAYVCMGTVGNANGSKRIDVWKFSAGKVSLNEHLLADRLLIYPNPAQSSFTISFETVGPDDVEITMMDITGKEIFSRKLANLKSRFEQSFDVSDYAKGTYMLRVKSAQSVVTRSIVKY